AGGHAHRIGKVEPAQAGAQLGAVSVVLFGREAEAQGCDRRAMGRHRVHLEPGFTREPRKGRDAQQGRESGGDERTGPGTTQGPSAATLSGATHSMAAVLSGPP